MLNLVTQRHFFFTPFLTLPHTSDSQNIHFFKHSQIAIKIYTNSSTYFSGYYQISYPIIDSCPEFIIKWIFHILYGTSTLLFMNFDSTNNFLTKAIIRSIFRLLPLFNNNVCNFRMFAFCVGHILLLLKKPTDINKNTTANATLRS